MLKTALALCLAIAFTNSIVNAIARAEEPAQTLQSLLAEARVAQSSRDFNAAEEAYRKAVKLDPSIAELWANLGLMCHESGKTEEAIRSFKEAIRLNPALFVPQLFLGIELLASKNPDAAIPFLEKAEKIQPGDLQAALNLGKAYAMIDRADHSAEAYARAARLAPKDGNIQLNLGTEYLQQVESDARLMASTYSHSALAALRAAETFAEEGKLVQAESAFKTALAFASPAPCARAEYGFLLLQRKRAAEAKAQFELEARSGSYCGLTALGLATGEVAENHPEAASTILSSLWKADTGFLRLNLPLIRDAVSAEQAKALIDFCRASVNSGESSTELVSLIEQAFLGGDAQTPAELTGNLQHSETPKPNGPANAATLFASGRYAKCSDALQPVSRALGLAQLKLLTVCSFNTGDFETASNAAQRLKSNLSTRAEGLYWESKADQKLAVAALVRAGEIDPDSPRIHFLLGNVLRQKRKWSEAEAEYRRAVALDPMNRAARLSLAITLFSELKLDESFEIDRGILAEDPDRSGERIFLAGEIFVQKNLYREAEPFSDPMQES